jgi:hypothetical protein
VNKAMTTRVVYLVEDGKNVIKQHNVGPNDDTAELGDALKDLLNKSTLPASVLEHGTNQTFNISKIYLSANNQDPNQPHKGRFEKKHVSCD